jgi:hypothetical protein
MPKCANFAQLYSQVQAKGKGATLGKKMKSLKGTQLMKDYMSCIKKKSGTKSKRSSMTKSKKAKGTRKARK